MIEFEGVRNPAREDAPEPRVERGYLAMPRTGNGPGVLVLHAWWGLNDAIREICQGLASEHFVALAPDLYGDGHVAKTIEDAERASDNLEPTRAEQITLGAIERLSQEATPGPIGVIGFSMGCGIALWAARKRPKHVGAVVLFYGTGVADGVSAPVLGHYGEDDEYEPREVVDGLEADLRASGRLAGFHRYPGIKHWFAEPDRAEFDAEASALAWRRTLELLRRELAE